MRRNSFWWWTYYLLLCFEIVAGVACTVLTVAIKLELEYWKTRSPIAGSIIDVTQEAAPVYLFPLLLGLGLAQMARKTIGPPWVWRAIQALLDRFQEVAFDGRNGPKHFHRVTLFRVVRFRRFLRRWPWYRVLVPVCRSWHTTQRSATVFRIPDNADSAEGVAGRAWAERECVAVHGLPDITANPIEKRLEKYAKATYVSIEWLHQQKAVARSFFALPVEVKGQIWGVVVLDSRDDIAIGERAKTAYTLVAAMLSQLLGRPIK